MENQIDDTKIDQYLNYVHEEEAAGKQFAEIEELLEEIVEYTKASASNWNPAIVWLLQKPWIARFVAYHKARKKYLKENEAR